MKDQTKLFKAFVYICLFIFALSIIVPVLWVFIILRKSEDFMAILGPYQKAFTLKTL